MKWEGRRQSSNVEDRRRTSGGKKAAFGGGILVAGIMLFGLITGKDTSFLVNVVQMLQGGGYATEQTSNEPLTEEEQREGEFAATILADTEDVWSQVFKQYGKSYQKPNLVLFSGSIESACGGATAAVGPFYCPADKKVYLDMSFFNELKRKFGAKMKSNVAGSQGDFAVAYVIAHEVGHHVQNLLGTSDQVHRLQQQGSERDANRLSVALELQADFYAGVFAHYEAKYNNVLETGDIEGAISAASAVGDDAIQSRTQGRVVPDAFTHGSSEQRVYWFKKGYQTGDMNQGDTFSEISGR
jgi:predicted metalloprotease